jgi:hypothetical protein
MDVNSKKPSLKLKQYIYFLIRCMILIKENKFDIGVISDNIINDEILNKKDSDIFNFEADKCVEYIDKFKKFITRVYKIKEQDELPKMNEYFLLILLKVYLDEKDNLNNTLEKYNNIKEINNNIYFKKLFNKNINGKSVKFVCGKFLQKPFDFIMEKLKE